MSSDARCHPEHPDPEPSTMPSPSLPWRIEPAPDPVDPALEHLLSETWADAWATRGDTARAVQAASPRLRGRLLERLAASHAAEAAMVTTRLRRTPLVALSAGVHARTLYQSPDGRPLRPGEPLRARWVELAPGSHWLAADLQGHSEWLVLAGEVSLAGETLGVRDYHVMPAGAPPASVVASPQGGRLFVRESAPLPGPAESPVTVRDAEAGWPDFAPGIRRRVLWQRDGQAALLYLAQAGAVVPHHTHGHDEECLMVQGELFLDDVLLQAGDYQLAPAGTGHRITETDTGVVIYAHGDLDLRFVPDR
ncbi:MAG: hypothetical protein RJA10_1759 [Pseudomonadota bacterium]